MLDCELLINIYLTLFAKKENDYYDLFHLKKTIKLKYKFNKYYY